MAKTTYAGVSTATRRVAQRGQVLVDKLAKHGDVPQWTNGYLSELGGIAHEIEAAIREEVERARERGSSWADIGRALAISKQAAQQRFGKV